MDHHSLWTIPDPCTYSVRFAWASQVTLVVKNLPASAGDMPVKTCLPVGLIPGLGRSPGGEHGNSLQYSCLENAMDRGDWWAIVHRVTQKWTWLKQLNTHTHTHTHTHTDLPIIFMVMWVIAATAAAAAAADATASEGSLGPLLLITLLASRHSQQSHTSHKFPFHLLPPDLRHYSDLAGRVTRLNSVQHEFLEMLENCC